MARMPYGASVAGHVLVSYSRDDQVYARRLVGHLRAGGVDVQLEDDDPGRGDHWDDLVAQQIDACAVLLPIMTPESDRSERVQHGIGRAQDSGRPIMPVLLAGRPFPRFGADPYEDVVGRRMPADAFVARLRELAPGLMPLPAPPVPTASANRPPRWRRWGAMLAVLRNRSRG
jgi:hypothetical protein